MRVGVFRCPPDDALWDEVNDNIGPEAHVVFPRTSVVLHREAGRVLSTPNHVVFYRPHERYRRVLHDTRGDISLFVAFEDDVELPDAPAGPATPAAFLLALRLARRLRDEPLLVEETAAALVEQALAVRHVPRGNRELAEDAKALLLERFTQPLSLQDLAGELHVSPFHLTRTFRAHTGFTLTRYVHELRLRAAVECMSEDPDVDLTRLAFDLGYCSLAHFSGRFSAAFGRPPSQVRNSMEAPAESRP
jgi:AraC-like DNA-binding protein